MPEDPSHLYLPSSRPRKSDSSGQLDLFATPETPAPRTPPPPPPAFPEPPAESTTPLFPDSAASDPLRDWSPSPLPLHRHLDDNPLFQKPDPAATRDVITHREGKPPLITGIYRKPRAPTPPLTLDISQKARLEDDSPTPGTLPSIPEIFRTIHAWFAAAPFPPWMAVSLAVAIPLVFFLAWLSIPRPPAPPTAVAVADPTPELPAPLPAETPSPSPSPAPETPPGPVPPTADTPPSAAPSPQTVQLAQQFQFANARVTPNPDGSISVVFDLPIFVSSAYLSPDGMKLLKNTAAKLKSLFPSGARVSVMGHTDDTPPSGNTPGLQSNDDIALARAQTAVEQLVFMTGHASRYSISAARPSSPPVYPFPNDSPANRRLNRTVTLRISPPAP